MRIRISDISPQGLAVETTLSLENLNQRLSLGDNHGIVFTEAPHVSLTVFKSAGGAETKGTVKSKYLQPCSTCLKEAPREVETTTNFALKPRNADEEDAEDGVGIVYFDGDHVDLEDVIQESLILTLSIYWSPPRDENGKCTLCGETLSQITKRAKLTEEKPTTLAELMKKAGIN